MSTMAENVLVAGAENRPPMLERSQYEFMAESLEQLKSQQLQTHLLQQDKELWMASHLKRRYVKFAKEIWDIVNLLKECSEL
ncbi:hypothetical protein Tco_1579150 [Tanacetum coccineum]